MFGENARVPIINDNHRVEAVLPKFEHMLEFAAVGAGRRHAGEKPALECRSGLGAPASGR